MTDYKKQAKQLLKPPKKDKGVNMPHFNVVKEDAVHQADILFLPTDKGFKYLLVVVDVNSRHVEAEPLKNKDNESVLHAFQKIYNRKILKLPIRMEVDSGSEFKGTVEKWFKGKKILYRIAKTARHRQQGLVERYNQIISVDLFVDMIAKQLQTNEINGEWIKNYKNILKELNKKAHVRKPDDSSPKCEGDSCNLLKIGTKVRVTLEQPKETTGQKLHGKFRSVDIRFDPKIRSIKEVLIKPGSPVLYLLDGNVGKRKVEPVGYTKNQLQVV